MDMMQLVRDIYSYRDGKIRKKLNFSVRDKFIIMMISELIEGFEKRGSRDGHAEWKPLKFATIMRKIMMGYTRPEMPLIATGEMQNSFDINHVNDDETIIYNMKDYFKYHELGSERLPKRDMMFYSEYNLKYLDKLLSDFVNEVYV